MLQNPVIEVLRDRDEDDFRPILVGQQPQSNDPDEPLDPTNPAWSGARLARMASLSPDLFKASFFRININYMAEEKFRVNEITRARARRIFQVLRDGDRVVLLGSAVEKCFSGLVPPLEPEVEGMIVNSGSTLSRVKFFSIPHPSGVNRIYNDPMNVREVGEFLRTLAGH